MRSPFIAKFKTSCEDCDDGIFPGEEIVAVAGAYSHVDCAPTLPDGPEHPTCPACWLQHPIGACDRG